MRRITFLAFLLGFSAMYAKTPIPEALWNAKTALVANQGAEAKDFEKLCKLLKEWGRFELVESRGGADIVIMLSTRPANRNVRLPNTGGGYGGVRTQQVLVSYMNIIDARDNTQLWEYETPGSSKDPKILVSKLRSEMKKKK